MKVLLLSADRTDRNKIAEWLGARGYNVTTVETAGQAVDALPDTPAFVFVDLSTRVESLKFLRNLVTSEHRAWVIAVTDRRDAGATSEALRLGVVDIVRRPVREEDVLAALGNAREFAGLSARQPAQLPEPPEGTIFTSSPRMRDVYELTRRIAANRCPVLIVGERGTGRETVARSLHHHGPLRESPFRRVAAAVTRRADLKEVFASAEGVIYIEGLGDLPVETQAWLEDWIGAEQQRERPSNTGLRLICAARPRIDALVASGRFSKSLYEAVAVVRIDLPALRERPQDIPLLAKHFLKEACVRHGVSSKTLSRSSLALLSALPWRGNAAELRVLLERLVVLVPRGVILQEDVLQHLRFDDVQARGAGGGTLREARAQFEREFIASTLQRHQWRMEAAAEELGIERTNLYRKMKQLSIIRGEPRS